MNLIFLSFLFGDYHLSSRHAFEAVFYVSCDGFETKFLLVFHSNPKLRPIQRVPVSINTFSEKKSFQFLILFLMIRISYLWASKRFSKPVNCGSLNTVRAFRRRQCLNAFTPIPNPRAISDGTEQPLPGKKFAPLKIPNQQRKSRVLISFLLCLRELEWINDKLVTFLFFKGQIVLYKVQWSAPKYKWIVSNTLNLLCII